jgi:hypothetical protein
MRCLRRTTRFAVPSFNGVSLVQTRGKRRNTARRTYEGVVVRLLEDIAEFGPKSMHPFQPCISCD